MTLAADLPILLDQAYEADRLAAVQSYGILDTPPEGALDDLVQLAAVILGTPAAAINLIDERRTWAKAAFGVPHGFEAPRAGAFCDEAIASPTEILVITDTLILERHAQCVMTGLGVRFYTGVPLVTPAGFPIGTLCVSDNEPRQRPSDVQLESLRTLANAVTTYLEMCLHIHRSEQLASDLEHLALHDSLTGIANRRSFDETLAREIALAARSNRPVSVVLLDLDHFKSLNDSHGHAAGDKMLRDVADVWQEATRATDFFARYGGEEFTVVVPDCSSGEAVVIADRMRAVMPSGQTSSAGVATWRAGDTAQLLLERADLAMYAAKLAGRNATRVGNGGPSALRRRG